MKTVIVALVTAAAAAVPAGAAGAIYGIHYMEKTMYFRDSPTGRQADTWRDENLRELLVRAINCNGGNEFHPDYQGDADCDGEG